MVAFYNLILLQTQFSNLNRKQVANFLARDTPIDEKELRWSDVQAMLTKFFVDEHDPLVEDANWPYIFVNEKEDDELEVQRFIVGFTTPFLLQRLQEQRTIYIDGTYRLFKKGFCLIVSAKKFGYCSRYVQVFGHCDVTRRFLPAGYAICNTENIWSYERLFQNLGFSPEAVMADGLVGLQTALTNGFEGDVRRLMCFYHAKTAMERKMISLQMQKPHRAEIMNDVQKMQRSKTKVEFFKLVQLILNKWREFGIEKVNISKLFSFKICFQIDNFADYFEATWASQTDAECRWQWFEGASEFGSTNNSLESFNGHFKDTVTERQRLDLRDFLPAARNSLMSFSTLTEFRQVPTKPNTDLPTMRKAYELRVKNRKTKSYGQGQFL